MTSLEGLNSLIQLESTRLEGAKQTNQNFQSVGSVVQQQGTQTAQSRMSMTINRIDAQYSKEVAMADVRKLEKQLARERAAEALAKNIACVVGIASAIGNLAHMFNDLNDRQKLGDTPDYLKSPPIEPSKAKLSITQAPATPQGTDQSSTVYLSGGIDEQTGSETVYSYDTAKDGVNVVGLPMAATITEYDKERIGGEAYAELKAKNGGKPLSFAEIHEKDPQLADRLVQVRGHGVSKSEAENLMTVANTAIQENNDKASTTTDAQTQSQGTLDASRLAAISLITSKFNPNLDPAKPEDASKIAAIAKIAGASNMTNEQKKEIFGNENPTEDEMKTALGSKEKQAKLFADPEFKKKVEETSAPSNTFFVKKNENGNEDVQYSNNDGVNFLVNDISPDDKAKILGDDKYKSMSFNEISKIEPNGQELAKRLLAGSLQQNFGKMTGDKQLAFLKNYPETKQTENMFVKLPKEEKEQLKKDYPKVFDGDKVNADEFSKLDSNDKDKILKEHPELFFNAQGLVPLFTSDASRANDAIKELGSTPKSNVKPLSTTEAANNIGNSALLKNIHTSKDALKHSLMQSGKIDNESGWDKFKKSGTNFLVKTVSEAAPYFQAYLKAKEKADKTYEELQAAIDKLNAASRKLRSMELQIDAFSGRGA